MCRDRLDRFVECLVTIPRDRYHTENRERVRTILLEAFGGVLLEWRAQLSESVLVRVYDRVRRVDGIRPIWMSLKRSVGGQGDARLERRSLGRAHRRDGEEQASDTYERDEEAFPPGDRSIG